ncbi:S41 family peptidase [Chryseobacterium vrystaatense]|uniref:C-terminal processing protease CtpA/Prc, contains a PDZ domain n=1 Tax=Chryseobacterium vrystaatense TaxID=307480 RepID=A0A1M5B5H6_9FLAO|nr:S41 family peptidase [Chryseobacterium vrystaatense]SHF37547.1 C-terminal processing protease CtpA/Prc, contains a PDZ domain [Chryseobacterium vrystaatense]
MKNKISILLVLLFICSPLVAQIPNKLSLNEKIYGLSKFWSDVEYNFVYLYKTDQKKWNEAYREAIANIQKTKNDYEYYKELQKLCTVLKDGHTQVYFPEDIQNQVMVSMFGEYRLFLMNVQGKIYIIGTNKSKEKEIPLGSEIIKVNGLSVDEYQEKFVKPYISSSTVSYLNFRAGMNLLEGVKGDVYDIEIKTPGGALKKLHLIHSKTDETAVNPEPLPNQSLFEFKWLKDNMAYVKISTFENSSVVKDFESKLPELKKAKGIVLDIRNNGGGSSKNSKNIAKYFIKGDTIYGAKNYSRKIIPTERALGSFLTPKDTLTGKSEWGLSKEETTDLYKAYVGSKFHEFEYKPQVVDPVEKLNVPAVVLTSVLTASAAEDFLIYLYGQKNIVRVGGYSNGSTGQPVQIELPGGGSAMICTKKVTLPDGEEFIGVGIKPDILIERNLNDTLYPLKFDSQLEAAIQYLKNTLKK